MISHKFHHPRGHFFGKEGSVLPRDVYRCFSSDTGRQGVAANDSGQDRVELIAGRVYPINFNVCEM